MPYLVKNLWKLPEFAHRRLESADDHTDQQDSSGLLAAVCRDCGQYNFPPTGRCRACHSPRTRTVSVSQDEPPHPGRLVFGNTKCDKPN